MTTFHPQHQTHLETLLRFTVLLAILVGYFCFLSWEYGASTGFSLALLTWSFFVLCTPIADGGFIIAFPVRLLFGVKMAATQIIVWSAAIGINLYMLAIKSSAYDLTFVTKLLKHILVTPYPYWSILIISALGTFLSILFGDEMMDVVSHKHRKQHHKFGISYRVILVAGLAILTITAYYFLLHGLHLEIPEID